MSATKVFQIKGIDVNTEDASVEVGKCAELVNMRCIDGKWKPVGDKNTISWLSASYNAYHVHTMDDIIKVLFYKISTGELYYVTYGAIDSTRVLIANIGANRSIKFC